jgi:hypothetical protein
LLNPLNADNQSFAFSSNHVSIRKTVEKELSNISSFRNGITDKGQKAFVDVVVAFWEVVYELERGDTGPGYWGRAYQLQNAYATAVARAFTNGGWQNWLLPVLYEACKALREFAIRADEEEKREGRAGDKLEDAARHLNKMFTLCLADRAPLEESRKWGTYYIVGLLFKTYFKVFPLLFPLQ